MSAVQKHEEAIINIATNHGRVAVVVDDTETMEECRDLFLRNGMLPASIEGNSSPQDILNILDNNKSEAVTISSRVLQLGIATRCFDAVVYIKSGVEQLTERVEHLLRGRLAYSVRYQEQHQPLVVISEEGVATSF